MSDLRFEQVANIKVFGIGGGGCNAVNRMVSEGVKGVEFFVANTDLQVLKNSPVENKIVLGRETTHGLGAGANPDVGRQAAKESENEIREAIKGSDMVFITAGLGGGTGTGAAPLFAKIAKDEGALTVGIVTKPFTFEGRKRLQSAESGLAELKQYVDSLIIVSNNNLIEVIGRKPLTEAFQAADNVLRQGVQTVTDLIAVPAFINLDFADVRAIMENQGSALIGIGMADGEDKAKIAAEKAIQSPLLEAQITGAKNAIVNITGGESVTLFDAEDAMAVIREAAGNDIDAIFGIAINENLGDSIIVTVIATGFEIPAEEEKPVFTQPVQKTVKVEPEKVRFQETMEDDDDEGIPSFFRR
ncbi:cell division protein FtsZ [[Eubacterium] hominis]|uniref:cell division protein FtsZ n=1 Tax=[Eubacterium] hominis TaxID=2764325 RepID=UPI003A4D3299